MAFYKSPEDMYRSRANRFKRDGDTHWAKAKNGEGDFHYGKAKICYGQAKENLAKAEKARATNATFSKKGKK